MTERTRGRTPQVAGYQSFQTPAPFGRVARFRAPCSSGRQRGTLDKYELSSGGAPVAKREQTLHRAARKRKAAQRAKAAGKRLESKQEGARPPKPAARPKKQPAS